MTSAGLRSRRWYAVTAAAMVAMVVSTLSIAVEHYTHATSGARALWFAAMGATAVSMVVAAVAFGRSALQWPDVSPAVRRLTYSRRDVDTIPTAWNALPRLHRLMLSAAAGVFGALVILVTVAEPALRAIDQRAYDALDAGRSAPLWGPEWFDRFLGTPTVVVPVALIITLFTLRCRVLALAYPAAIVAGGLANLGIGAVVGRHRPLTGEHPGRGDSFPSGGAIESVLLFGLLPLAVGVLLTSPTTMRVVRIAATGVLIVMLADNLRSGSHWPSDQLAGVAIATFVVVAVHAISRLPDLHDRCGDDCPALALARSRPGAGASS